MKITEVFILGWHKTILAFCSSRDAFFLGVCFNTNFSRYLTSYVLFGKWGECFSVVDRLLVLRSKFSTQHLHDLSFILYSSISSVSYVGLQAFQSSKTTACAKL